MRNAARGAAADALARRPDWAGSCPRSGCEEDSGIIAQDGAAGSRLMVRPGRTARHSFYLRRMAPASR
ncbi:MAG TPA: hypothetical protein DEA40_09290 [Parvularcula sp.]|nr:hypothetical protein [Parvularcula sp.]